ncbi:MAG: hypothetical protein L7H00_05135 [Vulcanisaeta sp.]|nr:hypothetical protein [Vulcanisaeta sp.]
MSAFVERVRDNVIVCREKDGKPECFWFKYGNTEQLAMVLGAMNIFDCNTVREIAQKAGVNVEDFVAKYCDSKPHPELYGVKPSSEEERIRAKVLLTVRRDGDAMIVCAGEYNCVRIKSCEPQHLARAIKLLNIHDIMYMLNTINCMESYGEVMRILAGEGYV